jgi:CheY-like chemotaxis protein
MATRLTCVLVESDREFLSVARHAFHASCPDFHVFEFCNGLDALAHLKHHSAALVITALEIPMLNGRQLACAVRLFYPTTPILIMSTGPIGHDDTANGVGAYIWKSALVSELSSTLERMGIATTPAGLGWVTSG